MALKIISDSSSDIEMLQDVAFSSVPLKIITDEKEYVDNSALDVSEMICDLQKYKGVSKSSCPNAEEWQQVFEDYDDIFCVTITSGLSGSYNSACVALNEHLEAHPEKRGFVVDTLSAGPETALIVEKIEELAKAGRDFEEIKAEVTEYNKKTHLIFALESLRNLANNGRVSAAVAKISGILGIRVIGEASEEGVLEILAKVKGYKKEIEGILKAISERGYAGGKIRIHHCNNLEAAEELAEKIRKKYIDAKIKICKTRALCSFYAESGGLLVGFEGN